MPRWTEVGGYVDAVSGLLNEGALLLPAQAPHHASGVWELPWFAASAVSRDILGGWSIAPALVYQSGQPWDMPGNVDLAPGVDLTRSRCQARRKDSSSTA